jgi:ParB-like chromosome segregation protein Spo0J
MLALLDARILSARADEVGEDFARYRIVTAPAVELMRDSLGRYGQLTPAVAFERGGRLEILDGFKRVAAVRLLSPRPALSLRVIDCDERMAKAAIYILNRLGGRTHDLEEAWIVQALVRDDGLSQSEVAELLGKHKSWVSRRLALVERLCSEAKQDLHLGYLSPTAAREIVKLPCGNQSEVLDVVRRESLSSSQTRTLVDAFLACATRSHQEHLLGNPQEVLGKEDLSGASRDPRLSEAGNRIAKRLGMLLDLLPRMEGWLRVEGRAALAARDLEILEPAFEKLAMEARAVAEAVEDFTNPLQRR